jgi:hypothetical protein
MILINHHTILFEIHPRNQWKCPRKNLLNMYQAKNQYGGWRQNKMTGSSGTTTTTILHIMLYET